MASLALKAAESISYIPSARSVALCPKRADKLSMPDDKPAIALYASPCKMVLTSAIFVSNSLKYLIDS